MKKCLYELNQYGCIQIQLKELMDDRKITRNALARAINTRFEVVDRWYNGYADRIDTDILARICYVLECTPGDILIYTLL